MTRKTNKVTFDKFCDYYYHSANAFMDFHHDGEWFGYIEKWTNDGRVCQYDVYFHTADIDGAEFTVGSHGASARAALAAAKDYIRAQAQKCQTEPANEDLTGYCWPR